MPDDLSKLIQDFARPNKERWEVREIGADDQFRYFYDRGEAFGFYNSCVDDVNEEKIVSCEILKQKLNADCSDWEYICHTDDSDASMKDCACCANRFLKEATSDPVSGICEECWEEFCLECVEYKDDECVFYCKTCLEAE